MKVTTVFILILSAGLQLVSPFAAADNTLDKTVRQFVTVVRTKSPKKIARLVSYPLSRENPIPPIATPAEFIKRFHEVFDSKLLNAISHSDISKDWSDMGWRGIMFKDGLLWLDEDGKITAVNYQPQKEKHVRAHLIRLDKSKLYSGLRQFKEPVLEWKTAKFHIRIDQLDDTNYRYAAWPVGQSTRTKPALVIEHGKLVWDGSGGNHYYDFKNGDYLYRCYVSVIGTASTPPGELEVSRNNKVILDEPVVNVIH